MASPTESHLRCRLGFHKWTRYKVGDTVAGEPQGPRFSDAARATGMGVAPAFDTGPEGWETRCRYCKKRKRLVNA